MKKSVSELISYCWSATYIYSFGCQRIYLDKTSGSVKNRTYQEKIVDDKNVSIKHYLETNHSSNVKDCKMLNIHNKVHRKIVESSIISNYNTIKQRS